MKFTCNTEALYEACINVSRAISNKTNIPVLEGVLFKTTEQGLSLTGYDLDLGIFTTIEAMIIEDGEIVLEAKIISEILRCLEDDKVSFETDSRNVCRITSGVSIYNINGMGTEEYPELPYTYGENDIILNQKVFGDMIRQTVFAVSLDDARVAHRGVKFEISHGDIKAIALDGYRFAMRHEMIDYKGEDINFIVPAKSLNEITKFVTDDDGMISLSPDEKYMRVGINGYNIVSRLLDGDFMDYKRIIPTDFETEVHIKSSLLLDKLQSMAILADDRIKSPVRCTFKDDELFFNINSKNGEADTKMDVEMTGAEIEIGFNIRYLSDAVRASDGDKIKMCLSSPIKPVVIKPLEGDSYFYLVLPVRFRN